MLDVVEAGTVQLAILSGLGDVQAAKAFGDLCDMVVLQMEAFGQIGHHHSSNQAFIDHDSFQHPDISSAKLQIGCLNFLTSLARAISAALRQLGPCSEVDTPSRSFPSAAEAQSKFTSTTPKEQRLALEDRLSILAHVAVQLAERTLFAATLGREAEEEKNTPPLPGIKPLVKPGASNPENHAGESNSRDASEDASLRQAAQGFLEFCVRTLCQELPLACFTLPSGSRGPPARPVAGGGMAEDGNGGNVAGSPLVAAKRRKLSGEDVGGLSGEGSGGQRGGNPGSGTMWPNVGVRAGVGYPSTVPPSNAAMDRDQPSTGGQVPGLPPLVDGAVASAKRLAQVCLRLYGDQVSGNQGVVGEAVAKVALRQLLLLLRTLSTSWQANGEAESALSQLSSTLDLAAFVRSWLGHGKSLVWQLVAGAAHTAQVTRIMQCASCSLPHGAVLPPFPGSNGGTVGINHDREQGFQRDERKLERAEAKQPEMLATLRRHVALLHLLLHSLYTIFSFLPQSLIEGITQPAGRAVRGDNPSGAKEQDGIDDDVSHTWERGDAGSTGTQGGDRKDKASRKGAVCIAPAVAGVGNGRQDGNVLAPQDGDAVGMGPEGWQGGCMRPAIDPSGCNDLLGSGGRAPGGLRGGGRIADEECSAGNKDILFGAGTHVQEDAAASGMANFVAMITGITGVACMMDGGVSLVSCRTCHMGHSSRRKDVDGELAQPPGRDEAGRLPLPSRGEITADGVKAVADSEALFNAALASVQKLFHLVWALAESFLQHPGVGGRCKATTVTAVGTGGGTMPTILAGLAAPEDDARARLADHTGNGKGGIACLDSRGEWEDSTAARALGRHASHSILQHECVMGSPESVLCLGRLATIQRLFLVASRPVQGPADLLGGSSNPAKSTSLTTTGTTTAAGDAGDGHDGSGHYNDDSGQTSLLLLRGECVRQLDWLLDATASSASVTMSPAFRSLLLAQASTLFADSCYVTLALAAATMSAGGAGNEPKGRAPANQTDVVGLGGCSAGSLAGDPVYGAQGSGGGIHPRLRAGDRASVIIADTRQRLLRFLFRHVGDPRPPACALLSCLWRFVGERASTHLARSLVDTLAALLLSLCARTSSATGHPSWSHAGGGTNRGHDGLFDSDRQQQHGHVEQTLGSHQHADQVAALLCRVLDAVMAGPAGLEGPQGGAAGADAARAAARFCSRAAPPAGSCGHNPGGDLGERAREPGGHLAGRSCVVEGVYWQIFGCLGVVGSAGVRSGSGDGASKGQETQQRQVQAQNVPAAVPGEGLFAAAGQRALIPALRAACLLLRHGFPLSRMRPLLREHARTLVFALLCDALGTATLDRLPGAMAAASESADRACTQSNVRGQHGLRRKGHQGHGGDKLAGDRRVAQHRLVGNGSDSGSSSSSDGEGDDGPDEGGNVGKQAMGALRDSGRVGRVKDPDDSITLGDADVEPLVVLELALELKLGLLRAFFLPPADLRDAGGAPGQPPPPQPLLLPPQAKAMASHAWRLAVRVLTAVLPAGGDMPWPATRGQPPGACERKKESTGIRPQDSGHFLAVLSAALRLLARSMEALSAPTGPGGQCGDFPSTNGAKVSPTVSSSSDQVSSAALCSQFFDIVARISRFLEPTHGDGDSTTSAVPGRAAGIESMASAQVPVRRNAGHAEPLSSMLGTAREAVPQANGGPPRHMGAASTGSRAVVVLPAWPVVSPLVAALAELVAAAGHLGHDDDDDQREGNHGGQNNTHSGDDFVQSNRGGRGGPIACADGSRVSQEGPCAVASIEAAVASLLALVIRPWLPAGPPTRAAAGRAEQDREGPCAIGQTGGGATQRPVDLPRPSSFPVMNHGFASQQAVAAPTTHEEDQNLAVPAAVPVAPSPWPLVHLSLARFLSYASVAASEGFARLIPRGWRANSVLRLAAERQKREREGGSSGGTGHGGAFTRDTGPSVHKTGLSPCYDEDEGVGHEEDSALFCQELLRFSKGEQQGDDHQAGDGADSFAWVKPCLTREDEVYALSRDSSAVACHHQACIRACLLDRATEGLQTVQAGMGLLRAVCRQMGMEDVQAHLLPAAAAENPGGGENPLGTVTTSPQDRSSLLLEWKMRDMQEQLGRAWDEALACLKD
eukprot:jgi/Mesvir1/25498/Mv01755-RA.3